MEESEKKNIELPYSEDFLLNLQSSNYSEKTVYNYERDLNVFRDFLGEIKTSFEKIDKKTILNYKAYLTSRDRQTAKGEPSEKKLSSFSINRMLSALRAYFKFLTDIDQSAPVPPDSIKLIKNPKKSPRVGEFNDLIALIECPSKYEKNKKVALRNRAMLETLFSTGMRISELINLKTAQIDNSGRIFIKGKGKKERFVYLTERARKHIKNYLNSRGIDSSDYLFVPYRGRNNSEKNKKISPNYLEERVKRYREFLGLNVPITVHGIRHGFATYLAESGANPAAIQILLGHESLDTTTRYVHASDRYAQKIHKKFHPLKN